MKLNDVKCGGMRGAKCRFFNDQTGGWNTDGAFAIGFLREWHCCQEDGCLPHFQLLCELKIEKIENVVNYVTIY